MKLCNYHTQQILLLLLHILRVLTVTDGARDYSVSSKGRTSANSWTSSNSPEPEPASPSFPSMKAVTPERISISESLAAVRLSESNGRESRALLRPTQTTPPTLRKNAQLGAIPCEEGSVQPPGFPGPCGTGSFFLDTKKDAQTLCSHETGARPKLLRKSPSKGRAIPRPSRIPIRPPRSHSRGESSRSSSMSPPLVPSPLAKTGQSAAYSVGVEAAYHTDSYTSTEEDALEPRTAAGRRSESESLTAGKGMLKHRREKFAPLRHEGASAESGATAGREEASDSGLPTLTGYIHMDARRQRYSESREPPRPHTRLRRRAHSYLFDERQFLSHQSLEHSFAELFETVMPELVGIAQSLNTQAAALLSQEDTLTGQIAFNVFNRRKILRIAPLTRRPAPQDYQTVLVVPECLLGVGGEGMVYQMMIDGVLTGSSDRRWAVKMHYNWFHENAKDKSVVTLRNAAEERVLAITRSLSLEYTPQALFSKFRFLVPYYFGEIPGLDPVLLPHPTDKNKFLLNLVTLIPLMSGSFDTVLNTKELTPAAKRVICFNFVELVARLHLQMLVHADLKPANFFLSSEGQIYLGDLDTVGWQNSKRRCGAMATVELLDPADAQCHIQSPDKLVPLTAARDAWSLGLCLFLVWCKAFPFRVLNQKPWLDPREFVSRLRMLAPDRTGGDSTTPKLDFSSCPGGMIADGLVLELIQRFLELDRDRRWTPVSGYKVILSAARSASAAMSPSF